MMDENKSEGIGNNIYTMLGGALLGVGIADQVCKAIAPTIQKLSSSKTMDDLKLLPEMQEKKSEEKEPKEEYEKKDNEIAELKRKLLEFEQKQHQI